MRRALASLTDDGLVYAIQGRGTFVASGRLAEPPNTLLSFHEMVANEHVAVGAQPLGSTPARPRIDEAEVFGIAPGAPLFELVRLRTLDELPVAIDSTTLPLSIDPGLPGLDWSQESLYARLVRGRPRARVGRLRGRGPGRRRLGRERCWRPPRARRSWSRSPR